MERTACLIIAIISLLLTGALGYIMIPWLRRLKYGQTINEIGPTWHKNKEGTPTIGGLMFVSGVIFSLIVGVFYLLNSSPLYLLSQFGKERVRFFACLGSAIGFGLIGFIDDYLKVINTRNLGLTAKGKLIMQFFVSAAFLFVLFKFDAIDTVVKLPFIPAFDMGIWFYPVCMIMIMGMVNAVNLTDGIDGLCSSVTFFVCVSFIIIANLTGYIAVSLFACAVAGGCAGFLIWNFHPAKVFMGDTGSMFLGGAVVAMAFCVCKPFIILLAGIVYLAEALSDIIQIGYFKITHGKRVFKMAPIHHHFEMCGWSEVKIVIIFSLVSVIGGALSIISAI